MERIVNRDIRVARAFARALDRAPLLIPVAALATGACSPATPPPPSVRTMFS